MPPCSFFDSFPSFVPKGNKSAHVFCEWDGRWVVLALACDCGLVAFTKRAMERHRKVHMWKKTASGTYPMCPHKDCFFVPNLPLDKKSGRPKTAVGLQSLARHVTKRAMHEDHTRTGQCVACTELSGDGLSLPKHIPEQVFAVRKGSVVRGVPETLRALKWTGEVYGGRMGRRLKTKMHSWDAVGTTRNPIDLCPPRTMTGEPVEAVLVISARSKFTKNTLSRVIRLLPEYEPGSIPLVVDCTNLRALKARVVESWSDRYPGDEEDCAPFFEDVASRFGLETSDDVAQKAEPTTPQTSPRKPKRKRTTDTLPFVPPEDTAATGLVGVPYESSVEPPLTIRPSLLHRGCLTSTPELTARMTLAAHHSSSSESWDSDNVMHARPTKKPCLLITESPGGDSDLPPLFHDSYAGMLEEAQARIEQAADVFCVEAMVEAAALERSMMDALRTFKLCKLEETHPELPKWTTDKSGMRDLPLRLSSKFTSKTFAARESPRVAVAQRSGSAPL